MDTPAPETDTETDTERHARYLATLRAVVRKTLAGTGARAVLFGSHATGTAHRGSDVDIAIDAPPDLPRRVIGDVREALEKTTVPWTCDVQDLRDASPAFRDRVLGEGILWTD
ncbi:nucleotidyltransferase family protein [Roseospira navarrensis]|uniref:Nucleotidyltransferase domain-containing protein n=1 Tax=Roseospira navarrensis TaxID=140058 RepID=A0A7X1ZDL5_9PROT|nr:nucleotidyltransferase domain-containing protein [Roseospira navarrensis]MQX36614.1 nucleotidyltransferase domain-containing protein [Roseospira navarrensis]